MRTPPRAAPSSRIPARTATAEPGLGEVEAALRRLDRFAHLSDEAYRVPGTRFRVGLDGIVGLVPGIGDGLSLAFACYPILEAWRLGASRRVILRMLANAGLDGTVGAVPILGDLFDFRFKSNRRNVELLKRHLAERR
jgi:hypothetical protein